MSWNRFVLLVVFLAVAALGAVLFSWLGRGSSGEGLVRRGADVRGDARLAGIVSGELAPPAETAEGERAPASRVVLREEPPAPAEQVRWREPGPLDYGVKGWVRYLDGVDRAPLKGVLRVVDPLGEEHSDLIRPDGYFQLYDLGPGWWTVLVELGNDGRAEGVVQLTREDPEAVLDLWPDPLVATEILVLTKWNYLDLEEAEHRPLLLVAHDRPMKGIQAWYGFSQAVSSTWLKIGERDDEAEFGGLLVLLRDEEVTLNLFLDGIWLATETRSRGENRVELLLDEGNWPLARGRLEVKLLDDLTDDPVESFVWTVGWSRQEWEEPPEPGVTVFSSCPSGWREIQVGGGIHERTSARFFVGPGETVKETIRLQRAISISGWVTSPEGSPGSATLALWRLDPERAIADSRTMRTCRTGPKGSFRFHSLRAGRYLLRSIDADEPDRSPAFLRERRVSRFLQVDAFTDRVDVQLELELASSLVLTRSQLQAGPVTWHLEDPAGRWIRKGRLETSAPFPLQLPVGSYRLVGQREGGEPFTVSLEVGTGVQVVEL